MITVPVAAFHRALLNCRVFQVGKAAQQIAVKVTETEMQFSISDNQTYVTDTIAIEEDLVCEDYIFGIPVESARGMAEWLGGREDDGMVALQLKYNGGNHLLLLEEPDDEESGIGFAVNPIERQKLVDQQALLDENMSVRSNGCTFSVYPERWSKINRMKVDGKPPLALKYVDHAMYGPIVLFKYGPTIRGALATLEPSVLQEKVDAEKYLW